jgi:hypothetical protein
MDKTSPSRFTYEAFKLSVLPESYAVAAAVKGLGTPWFAWNPAGVGLGWMNGRIELISGASPLSRIDAKRTGVFCAIINKDPPS